LANQKEDRVRVNHHPRVRVSGLVGLGLVSTNRSSTTPTVKILMKVLAAYLLSSLSGEPVDKKKITAILSSVGIDAGDRVDSLLEQLEGKDLQEVFDCKTAHCPR
jgi:hypothetical protein